MLSIKNYVRAQSLEEAYQLDQKKRNCVLGGMLWLRMSDISIDTAIDLGDLGLDTVTAEGDRVLLGSYVTLRQLETDPLLKEAFGGACEKAVRDIVGIQFRDMATVGGSIWGRFGFSDVLTLFLALGADVELYHAGTVPLERFIGMKPDRDILVRLSVPRPVGPVAYRAARLNRTDFPLLTCCAAQTAEGLRIAIGARPGRAVLLRDEEGLLRDGVDRASADALARRCAAQVQTGTNSRGSAAYRTRLVRTLVRRCLLELGGMPDEA